MAQNILLTPGELYFLGKLMQARYIDYAYVAGMDDISQHRDLYEKETTASLVRKNILMEDFSGDVEIDPGCEDLLRPVFFGETETSMDAVTASTGSVTAVKFHYLDGKCVSVSVVPAGLLLNETDETAVREMVSSLVPEDLPAFEPKTVDELPREKIDRIYAFKKLHIGSSSERYYAVLSEGNFYTTNAEGDLASVSAVDFVKRAYETIRG